MANPPPKIIYRRQPDQRPSGGFFSLKKLLTLGLVLGLLTVVGTVLDSIKERWYIFDPVRLKQIQEQALAKHPNDMNAIVQDIVTNLRADQPQWAMSQSEEWFFNNAGGAMGGVYILHASITEYLIIFGTSVGTEGHTGRHTADDYFYMLKGEENAYALGSYEKESYPAGTMHHLTRGTIKQYKLQEDSFAMEYARGWIPPMLVFGFADLFTSVMDPPTVWETVRITGKNMIRNLLHGKI